VWGTVVYSGVPLAGRTNIIVRGRPYGVYDNSEGTTENPASPIPSIDGYNKFDAFLRCGLEIRW
jgi:hypothetical protein